MRFHPIPSLSHPAHGRGIAIVKFLLDNWYLILLALGSGTLLAWPVLTGAGASAVSPAQAVHLINREKAVLIDVCEADEYVQGHATGARNIPLSTLAQAKGLPTNTSLPLVLMCQSGARSGRAVAMLKKQGYAHVHSLAGGLKAWREASLPVDRETPKS